MAVAALLKTHELRGSKVNKRLRSLPLSIILLADLNRSLLQKVMICGF